MNQDFFTYLPSEIIIDILSRLPIRTIVISKCVCKPWLLLLETDEFVDSHLAKSVPMLACWIYGADLTQSGTILEFEDGLDLQQHDLHYNPFNEFDFPHRAFIRGSANGLLLLHKTCYVQPNASGALYVCNPITRDYIELHYPEEFKRRYPQVVTFGFGVSKITGQYKVVRISIDSIYHKPINAKYECHVHTLGTESWRSIEHGAPFNCETPVFPVIFNCVYDVLTIGAFVNGNLHWIVSDSNGNKRISCFDLEAERFSTFSTPPLGSGQFLRGLTALEDHLCFCDNTDIYKIVIWLMKEYGVDKSWTKQYVIGDYSDDFDYEYVSPIKVFRDGDILIYSDDYLLRYYSSKTNAIQESNIIKHRESTAIILTPSFLSLKSLGMENVISF